MQPHHHTNLRVQLPCMRDTNGKNRLARSFMITYQSSECKPTCLNYLGRTIFSHRHRSRPLKPITTQGKLFQLSTLCTHCPGKHCSSSSRCKFRDTLQADHASQLTVSCTGNPNFMHDVRNIALYFLYLALGSMAGAIIQTTCWMYVGNRQTNRLRLKYLAAVLAQNIGFFDVQATTGE